MVTVNLSSSAGPGTWSLLLASGLWVFCMLVVLFHRAGIQVLGTGIACLGFLSLLLHNSLFLALSLFVFGVVLHGCGRLLFHLRRRE